jgi:hypothetical protein
VPSRANGNRAARRSIVDGDLIEFESLPNRQTPRPAEARQIDAREPKTTAGALRGDEDNLIEPSLPITPAKPAANGSSRSGSLGSVKTPLLKTPLNNFSTPSRAPWDDSPRPEAMTPLLFAQLKEKKHERTWWLKRQELMDKASPLRSKSPDLAQTIWSDLEELEKGEPSMRNLQKLALLAESYPIVDEEDGRTDEARLWRQDGTFNRIFVAITAYLKPTQVGSTRRRPI